MGVRPPARKERNMEELLQVLGTVTFVLLLAVGALAGWLASVAAGGRNRALYIAVGVAAAVLAPFVAAALGLTALVASGLVAILMVAAIGALVVLLLVRLIFK